MSKVVYVVFCTACQAPMEIESVTDEWLDGKPVSGHFACSRCGKRYGVWMDGGTLDLDYVREHAEPSNDFWVYEGPLRG